MAWQENQGIARCVREGVSSRRLKDTFDGSSLDKSLYEIDINEGLENGWVESQTEVHVESEVVKETTTRARATCCARFED